MQVDQLVVLGRYTGTAGLAGTVRLTLTGPCNSSRHTMQSRHSAARRHAAHLA